MNWMTEAREVLRRAHNEAVLGDVYVSLHRDLPHALKLLQIAKDLLDPDVVTGATSNELIAKVAARQERLAAFLIALEKGPEE